MSDLIKLAEKNNIEIPQFVDDYSNQFETLDDLKDIDKIQDFIYEYADNYPSVYNYDIEQAYIKADCTIDELIDEGLVTAMESESDIINAKRACLVMDCEREVYGEVREFIELMDEL